MNLCYRTIIVHTIGASLLPGQSPVMVLPGAVLFPRTLMPLYIFEPRYRLMLQHALERDRVFCVAMLKDGVDEPRSAADIHEVAGIGLVRACVAHEDGTSHLVLQGLARVHLDRYIQEAPFRVASIRSIDDSSGNPAEIQALSTELRSVCAGISIGDLALKQRLEEQLAGSDEPAALADMIANTYLQDAARRQEALEEQSVRGRLRLLLSWLREV